MKRNNKKGFTIVELVIVIAVIAILAAVLIPTFSNIINNANESAAMQSARTAYTNFMTTDEYLEDAEKDYIIKVDDYYYFEVVDGQFNAEPIAAVDVTTGYTQLATDVNLKGGAVYKVNSAEETPTT